MEKLLVKSPKYFAFLPVATCLFLLATNALAAAPSVSLIANRTTIERGQSATLSWIATNAYQCSGNWAGYYLGTNNQAQVYPQVTTEYGISCNGSDGIATANVTVYVTDPTAIPSTTYYSNPTITQTSSPTPVYYPASAPAFTAACATGPTRAQVGQSVTFAAASSGGASPVRYQWIGDVQGIGQTQTISFSSLGTKTASVTVVDANNRTAVGTCRVEIIETVVSAPPPAPAPKAPVATVASAKIEPIDYEKICLEKGFVKPSAEVAEGEGTGEENPEVAAAATSRFSGAAFLPLLLLSNLFFILVTAYFSYRFGKRTARKIPV